MVGRLDARPFLTKRPAACRSARSCEDDGLRMVGNELEQVEVGEMGGEIGDAACCAGRGGSAVFGGGIGGAANDGTDMRTAALGLFTG